MKAPEKYARVPNVYEMYVHNGSRCGFFVRRRTWGNTVARIVSIADAESGELRGKPPYFGDPEVMAEFYDLRTGELMNVSALSCPGTFQYTQVNAASLPEPIAKLTRGGE